MTLQNQFQNKQYLEPDIQAKVLHSIKITKHRFSNSGTWSLYYSAMYYMSMLLVRTKGAIKFFFFTTMFNLYSFLDLRYVLEYTLLQ